LIPATLGVFFINLINERFLKKEGFKTIIQKYLTVITFGFLGLLLSIVYLPRALNILFLHATIRSGWDLPKPNVIGIFFSPFYISNGINGYITELIWLGLLCATLGIFYINVKAKRANVYFIVLISIITIVYILQVIIRGQGFGYYQNWKLLSYILPLIIIVFLAELYKVSNKGSLIILPFLLGGIISPFSLWKNGNNFGTPSIINSQLIELQKVKDVYKIDDLNVMVGPFYQTMAVGLVTDIKQIYFSSPTYYPVNSNKDFCSLVENSDVRFSNKIQINESYSLISSENLNCDIVNVEDLPKLQLNTEYIFDENNIENRKILDRGWSYPENWGTWSLGENSRIRFNLSGIEGSKGKLVIKFNSFAPKENNESKLRITLNGINLAKMPPISNENVFEIEVNNLNEVNNTLEFSYSNVKTPKDLKISEDGRLIFLGIKSILIGNGIK
jgi:hypothetical protein